MSNLPPVALIVVVDVMPVEFVNDNCVLLSISSQMMILALDPVVMPFPVTWLAFPI
jgi:hypothetical protein